MESRIEKLHEEAIEFIMDHSEQNLWKCKILFIDFLRRKKCTEEEVEMMLKWPIEPWMNGTWFFKRKIL